jgi:hypothetical protein
MAVLPTGASDIGSLTEPATAEVLWHSLDVVDRLERPG